MKVTAIKHHSFLTGKRDMVSSLHDWLSVHQFRQLWAHEIAMMNEMGIDISKADDTAIRLRGVHKW